MSDFGGIAPTPPRLWELWAAMPARLDTARMQSILGGVGRVKLETESMTALGAESTAWGRVVIAPVRRLYGELDDEVGRRRIAPFLIRSEIHAPDATYQPAIALEAAQNEAFARLHGWEPSGFTYGRVVGPIVRETPPQALPLWDGSTGLWFLSSVFRAVMAPA